MATEIALAHAEASARLAPKLSFREELVKFVSTKPLGAAGARRASIRRSGKLCPD